MNFKKAQVRQDQRLRRCILEMLKTVLEVNPSGRCGGRYIADELERDIEDDQHLLRLLRELALKELVSERDTRKLKSDRFGLGHLDYGITAKGQRLLAGHEPVDPDVEDERRGPDDVD